MPAAGMSGPAVPVWVGTYPPAGAGSTAGRGEGIWLLDVADPQRGARRVAEVPAASFLARHPTAPRLYAVSEDAPGSLTVLRPGARPWSLEPVAVVPSGGAFPCHVSTDPAGRRLFVAHYGDGVVATFALDAAGDLDGPPALLPSTGHVGPRRDRQDGPHAHAGLVTPDGHWLIVADLGTDELRRYRLPAVGAPEQAGAAAILPPGSGPRHLALPALGPGTASPTALFVTLELSAELAVLDWDSGSASGTLRSREPLALAPAGAEDERGRDVVAPAQPSHLVVDGEHLHVGVRGPDVVMTFRAAELARPTLVAATPTPAWPRHFAIVGDWLVVAGERADAVGLYRRTGAVGDVGSSASTHTWTAVGRVPVPAPACLLDAAGWPA